MTGLDFRHYPSREVQAEALAGLLAGRLRTLLETSGRAAIAVPGGTTPGPMLRELGLSDLDWSKVAVTLTDERQVPVSSPRSNARLLTETLLAGAAISARFVPLYCRNGQIDSVYRRLRTELLPLDLAVLGMGEDMHTASLFPGATGLAEALAPNGAPVVAITAPGAEEPRMTLSAPVLAASERHILIQGPHKRAALERACRIIDPRIAPISAFLNGATVHYAN